MISLSQGELLIIRKIQFLKEFENNIDLPLPKITLANAYPGDIPVAQKTLNKLSSFTIWQGKYPSSLELGAFHKKTVSLKELYRLDEIWEIYEDNLPDRLKRYLARSTNSRCS